jgi:uncharacterized protein (DUF433 family)
MDNFISYISINPDIRFGKPCITGTRIAVTDILQWLASEMSYEEILDNYPKLQEAHILAALKFAANRESSIKIIEEYESLINGIIDFHLLLMH